MVRFDQVKGRIGISNRVCTVQIFGNLIIDLKKREATTHLCSPLTCGIGAWHLALDCPICSRLTQRSGSLRCHGDERRQATGSGRLNASRSRVGHAGGVARGDGIAVRWKLDRRHVTSRRAATGHDTVANTDYLYGFYIEIWDCRFSCLVFGGG